MGRDRGPGKTVTPWGWGESSVFSVLRDSTSLRLQNFAVKFQKVLGGESIDRACLSTRRACAARRRAHRRQVDAAGQETSQRCMPRRATCGGRVGLRPASPLGHDATQSPWRRHGQPDWRARPTTQGGQGAAQGRAGRPEAVRCRPPPAACRLPPPAAARRPPATVKACGPASSTCRRDGTAWAGNSWLPRAVGTFNDWALAASRAERF